MNRSKSKNLFKKFNKYIFSGVNPLPNIIKYGKGSYVVDVDNNNLLDLNAGQFCSIFGHAWPKIDKIITAQSKKIFHTGTNTISQEVLFAAKEISKICIEMDGRAIFLSTGSEAVECALRFAKSIKKKNGFVCFKNGYHGLSLGSQSVTFGGNWALPKVDLIYSLDVPVFHELSIQQTKIAVKKSLNNLERLLILHIENIAGLIMEPVISVGGMNFLTQEYCDGIYSLCKKYNVFLLYDECQTGIGRTGKWFNYQHTNTVPDILISAKAIGLGFPVSIVVFNNSTVDLNLANINHFSSHQNDPISAAIAIEVIKEIREKKLLKKVEKIGKYFLNKLIYLSNECDFIKNPRGKGLMLGFDIYLKNTTSYTELSKLFLDNLLEEGVMLQSTSHGKTYRLLPNYLVSRKEIDFFIEKLLIVSNKMLNNVK